MAVCWSFVVLSEVWLELDLCAMELNECYNMKTYSSLTFAIEFVNPHFFRSKEKLSHGNQLNSDSGQYSYVIYVENTCSERTKEWMHKTNTDKPNGKKLNLKLSGREEDKTSSSWL